MNMDAKLDPCPFCGGSARLEMPATSIGLPEIRCRMCGAAVKFRGCEEWSETPGKWNARNEKGVNNDKGRSETQSQGKPEGG